MNDDDSRLRQLLVRSAPDFEPLDGAALRSASEHRPRPHLVSRVLLPAAVALLVIAVAVTTLLIVRRDGSTADHHDTAAHSGFRIQLVLPATSFPANGQPINAYALAINDTGHPITIANACNGWIQAGLAGKNITFEIRSDLVRCAGDTLPLGTTRIPMTIPTTFTQCQQGNRPGTPDMPHCLGRSDSRAPNLPAGHYLAEVATTATSIHPDLPDPQNITLTPEH